MSPLAGIDSSFEAVAELIRGQAGLVFRPNRLAEVENGTRKIMAAAGIRDPRECLGRLKENPALLDDLISELTIGETYFFREPGHFAFVRDEVVREVRRLRGAEHILRVWSAGCASGEEPYSLAILFEEMGLAGSVRILATDISRTALARAQQAAYGSWSLRGEGARLIGSYLRRSGSRFELAERFRRRVEFAYLNLAQDSYPTFATSTYGMDLILCRNVLIYLDAKTIRLVAQRLYESLAEGGFLITGPADPALAGYAPFEARMTSAGFVYRKPSHLSHRATIVSGALQAPLVADFIHPDVAVASNNPPTATSSTTPTRQICTSPADPLAEARQALVEGENARALELAGPMKTDAAAAILCVRALANLGDTEQAAALATEAATRHPASPEIGFLLAVILTNLGRHGEAERALRRVLYLDRSLAVAWFTLGATLHRLGDVRGSLRAYRNARDLAAGRPSPEIVPLSDGETAGRLAEAATAQVALLEPDGGTR